MDPQQIKIRPVFSSADVAADRAVILHRDKRHLSLSGLNKIRMPYRQIPHAWLIICLLEGGSG